jgi:hypothetical protein
MNLTTALRNQIGQSPKEKITLGTALSLTFVGYPLIAKDLEDLPDLLKHLPS